MVIKQIEKKHSLVAKLILANPKEHEYNAVWGQAHAEVMLPASTASWGMAIHRREGALKRASRVMGQSLGTLKIGN